MEYKTEFSFPLSEELLKTLGIDEADDDIDLSLHEKCVLCPNFCWHCKKCTIDI